MKPDIPLKATKQKIKQIPRKIINGTRFYAIRLKNKYDRTCILLLLKLYKNNTWMTKLYIPLFYKNSSVAATFDN